MVTVIDNRARKRASHPGFIASTILPTHALDIPGQASSGTSDSFTELAAALWRRKWFLFFLALLGGALVGFAGLLRTPLYEATAQVLVDPPGSSPNAISPNATIDQAVTDNIVVLSSPTQLERTITALNRQGSPAFAVLQKKGSLVGLTSRALDLVASWGTAARNMIRGQEKHESTQATDPFAPAVDALGNGLRVTREGQSRVITVGFTDADPDIAAAVANRFVEVFVDQLAQQNRESIEREIGILDDAIPKMEGELTRAVREKDTYLLTDPFGAVTPDATNRLSRLHALELQLVAVTSRYDDMLGRRESLIERVKSSTPGISILSRASAPTEPRTLSALYLIPPGIVFFGLLGSGLVLIRNRSDDRIRGEPELEAASGVRSAGILPKFRPLTPKAMQDALQRRPNSPHARASSSILLSSMGWPDSSWDQTVLITATKRDDAKAELAWALALTASRFGQRVLLVDFDLRDPLSHAFHEYFGVATGAATLADLAGQQCSLANAIDSFEEIGVDYLRSGSDRIGLLTLSYARDIKRVLEELNAQYSLIILNGPSVTDGPDVFLLANCAHEILFSWRWRITRKNVARKALELFMTIPGTTRAIRSVLMQVDLKKKMLFENADTRDLLRASS